jgi:hypothetical protein
MKNVMKNAEYYLEMIKFVLIIEIINIFIK